MKARLRSVFSSDVDDLDNWRPPESDFSLVIRLLVGPDTGPGEESFDLTLCTGGWLAAQASAAGCYEPRHHLIVDRFDWRRIRGYIVRRVEGCDGQDWNEVAEKVSRFAYWEFEDFHEN